MSTHKLYDFEKPAMSFIDSYKRLEKLCSEIYGASHGLSAYIDEMIGKPNGSYYVSGWNEDLKQLKHYRWVRNQIVHEPGCTEEKMCDLEGAQWIDNFYSRIMSTNDPLALYRKARSKREVQKPKQTYSPEPTRYKSPQYKKMPSESTVCLTYLMGVLIGVAAAVLSAIII